MHHIEWEKLLPPQTENWHNPDNKCESRNASNARHHITGEQWMEAVKRVDNMTKIKALHENFSNKRLYIWKFRWTAMLISSQWVTTYGGSYTHTYANMEDNEKNDHQYDMKTGLATQTQARPKVHACEQNIFARNIHVWSSGEQLSCKII